MLNQLLRILWNSFFLLLLLSPLLNSIHLRFLKRDKFPMMIRLQFKLKFHCPIWFVKFLVLLQIFILLNWRLSMSSMTLRMVLEMALFFLKFKRILSLEDFPFSLVSPSLVNQSNQRFWLFPLLFFNRSSHHPSLLHCRL